MGTSDIYREIILDYYRNPRNYGKIEKPDVSIRDSNPLCGDEIEMQLKFEDGKVVDVKFNGKGCAISQASASMLTEMVMGKTIDEVRKIGKDDILESLGLTNLGPARIKCALLSLKTLKLAVYSYLAEKLDKDATELKDEASKLF
ncbi:MAG: SUF system NifU family Fe-S cluster assembly protein [Candidatus Nitrosothermus koennekii]|nr:MAG: SUF system NifU family Fe-S cluster assembly protein [Candidatus Nitrosothermus koennekii]